jgi:hypothetical protein
MMLCLALRSDPKLVYQRALGQFSVEEITEGFAAARGLALPSQLRRMLRDQGRGVHAAFLRLLPARPRPVRIQRWSARRVGLLLLAVLVAALLYPVLPVVLGNSDLNTTRLQIVTVGCDRPEPLWLQAQAVPSASLVPCLRELPGWKLAGANARNGWSQLTLNHDRAGEHAMVVRLTATCDPAGAAEQASRHPGVRRYQRVERLAGGRFGATWYDRFPGGCVTSRLQSATDPDGRFAAEAPAVLEYATRQALRQRLEERSGGRLHLDPVPRDSG